MNMHRNIQSAPGPARQRGVVLVVSLIFLLLLTILAVSASSGSLLQEKMVGATRNGQLAEWAAESTLRGIEWKLYQTSSEVGGHVICVSSGASLADSQDSCVRYSSHDASGVADAFRSTQGWQASLGGKYENPGFKFTDPKSKFNDDAYDTARLADDPRYLIEDLGPSRPPGATAPQETGTTGLRSGGTGKINIHTYRITARAAGGNDKAVRVLQSTFDAQTSN